MNTCQHMIDHLNKDIYCDGNTELNRIKNLHAFNVRCKSKKKINQYRTIYLFADSSTIHINPLGGIAYLYACDGRWIGTRRLLTNK